jgi:hypothetical protein
VARGGAREMAGGEPERRFTPAVEEPGEAEQGEQRRLRNKGMN